MTAAIAIHRVNAMDTQVSLKISLGSKLYASMIPEISRTTSAGAWMNVVTLASAGPDPSVERATIGPAKKAPNATIAERMWTKSQTDCMGAVLVGAASGAHTRPASTRTSVGAVALLPTLLAITIGVALGLHWGGRLDNLTAWRPPVWQALVAGVTLLVILDLVPMGGAFGSLLRVLALGSIVFFGVVNMRVGGMVLVVAGTSLDLLVTVLNWGMPVSGSALVSAGIVSQDELASVQLSGGRELADGAILGFLGDVIPLPWGHVISIGDVIVLIGVVLVTSSVTRRYQVGGGGISNYDHRGGGLRLVSSRGGTTDYRSALDALGRGPAPRRGPGLHPSRLPEGADKRRRSPARGPKQRAGRGPR